MKFIEKQNNIRPQYTFLSEDRPTKFYKFPDQIDELATYLGLPTPVPKKNVSKSKPVPTADELTWLTEYYKKDIELYENII